MCDEPAASASPAPGAHVMLFRQAMADAASERALRGPVHECFVER